MKWSTTCVILYDLVLYGSAICSTGECHIVGIDGNSYGNEDSDLTLVVNRDGQLVLPRLGPLSVSGLTFDQVKEVIDAKVASQFGWY